MQKVPVRESDAVLYSETSQALPPDKLFEVSG